MTKKLNMGLVYALSAFIFWGFFPIYWKPLEYESEVIPVTQIIAHRLIWSALFALLVIILRNEVKYFISCLNAKVLVIFFCTGVIIFLNWWLYIWAIYNERVIDASLGYFINPLVNVLLGYIFLKERLKRLQFVAIIIAMLGLLWLTISQQEIPFIALILAVTFAVYGLIRKLVPMPALFGIFLENLLILPFAITYLVICYQTNQLVFFNLSNLGQFIIVGSGVVTVIPLLLFVLGAKRISLTNLGMIQYISPSLQFLVGVLVFNEALNINKLIGCIIIWIAVAVYLFASYRYKPHTTASRLPPKIKNIS